MAPPVAPPPGYNYDNVRGEMRGPFVRYNPEGGMATLAGGRRYQEQSETLGVHFPKVFDEERSREIFIHDSQFV
jgi:hypothetical protein